MIIKVAVNGFADYYKSLVAYCFGTLDKDDMAAIDGDVDEIKAFINEEDSIIPSSTLSSLINYGIKEIPFLYNGDKVKNVWEIFIDIADIMFEQYVGIIPVRIKNYFNNWLKEPHKLLGCVCVYNNGEIFNDYLSNKKAIKKYPKTIVIQHVSIDGVEFQEGTLINVLEYTLSGPVNDYDIDDETADKLVKLGYLELRWGSRQARLYSVKDKEKCEKLYEFLFSDDDKTMI